MTPTYDADDPNNPAPRGKNEALTEAGVAGKQWRSPYLGAIVHFMNPKFGGKQAAIVCNVIAPSSTDGGIVNVHVFPTRSSGHVEIGVPHASSLGPQERENGKRWEWPDGH